MLNVCGDTFSILKLDLSFARKFYLKNSILVANKWAMTTRVDLHVEKMMMTVMIHVDDNCDNHCNVMLMVMIIAIN